MSLHLSHPVHAHTAQGPWIKPALLHMPLVMPFLGGEPKKLFMLCLATLSMHARNAAIIVHACNTCRDRSIGGIKLSHLPAQSLRGSLASPEG